MKLNGILLALLLALIEGLLLLNGLQMLAIHTFLLALGGAVIICHLIMSLVDEIRPGKRK